MFSCEEDIKIDTLDKHKGATILDKYSYGSVKTSVLVLKKNGVIYRIKCYNSEIESLKTNKI